MKKFITLFSIIFLTSGCSLYTINSRDVTEEFYPSKKSADEVVYLENVDQPHEVISYVTVNTERRQRMSDIIEKMKYEAAILGGDAVTDIQTDATGTWKKFPAQKLIGNGYVRANFTAAVAVFK